MSGFAEELLTRFRWIGGHADVLGLLSDVGFLARSVAALAEPFESTGVTKVAGVEARGFVFGRAWRRGSAPGSCPSGGRGRSIPGRR